LRRAHRDNEFFSGTRARLDEVRRHRFKNNDAQRTPASNPQRYPQKLWISL
jgi:hypothetical protein